jgi:CheY-like chemotaxis protein
MLKRILLAEDDPKDVELTISALAENDLANEIMVVRDGADALDYLYRRGAFAGELGENPAVVVIDLKMPRKDGMEVLKQLKSDRDLRVIPVVVLTSSRESQDLHHCYELGANAYVVKPVKFSEFVDVVRNLSVFWASVNEPPPGCVQKSQ